MDGELIKQKQNKFIIVDFYTPTNEGKNKTKLYVRIAKYFKDIKCKWKYYFPS